MSRGELTLTGLRLTEGAAMQKHFVVISSSRRRSHYRRQPAIRFLCPELKVAVEVEEVGVLKLARTAF